MYKYVYKRVKYNFDGWTPASGNIYCLDEHQEIINTMAKKGYRYVGFIPVKQRGTGHIQEMDLIFETKESKKA